MLYKFDKIKRANRHLSQLYPKNCLLQYFKINVRNLQLKLTLNTARYSKNPIDLPY